MHQTLLLMTCNSISYVECTFKGKLLLKMMRLYLDRVIADIEIINIVENALRKDAETFLDTKTLNTAYNNLLGNEEKFHCNCKST